MIQCSIKGCEASESEYLATPEVLDRWFRARACQCGALIDKMTPCICQSPEGVHPKITYWPNLDWWILGGVEEVILCPDHRRLVINEIIRQQKDDPSMESPFINPTNRH